jgi:uncharacterized protein with HEPN domain
MNRLDDYLAHMQIAAVQSCQYVEGMIESDFVADKRTQQAVILNLIIIGEAATKILKDEPAFVQKQPQILLASMKGMRNRIAHGYFEINLDVVWETTQTALPTLIQQLHSIISERSNSAPKAT